MNRDLEPQLTDNEKLLNKIDRRDKLVRTVELAVLCILMVFVVISFLSFQQSTLEARKANISRQDTLKNYMQCVFLLTKKYPNVNFQTLNYDQAKIYLDKCASVTK